MIALFLTRVAPAAALFVACVAGSTTAWAGRGGPGGVVLRAGRAPQGAPGGFHGVMAAPRRFGVSRSLPPVSGVIHEQVGMRPWYSAYGHTATAMPVVDRGHGRGGENRGYDGGHGGAVTAVRYLGFGRYGHVDTAVFRRPGFVGRRERRIEHGLASREWPRWAAPRWRHVYGGGYGGDGDVGSAGIGDDTGGTYGTPGIYGSAGTYGGGGPYGASGTYGRSGTYGYVSETPLAARFAEPPLAPGPGAPYSPDDRYAYAASEDVGPGPRVIVLNRVVRHDCGCGPRVQPIVYRYGIGTAY